MRGNGNQSSTARSVDKLYDVLAGEEEAEHSSVRLTPRGHGFCLAKCAKCRDTYMGQRGAGPGGYKSRVPPDAEHTLTPARISVRLEEECRTVFASCAMI